ncbi:phage tail sheath subtilisin-like domain-containing protein [Actinoplanes sp. NPDC023714]|uniref:phage tail sheath subtilisin-like domain-containing protein n=1 Tax=Actinoplanes sp. NPDC023714 TaxID=3154322 RepID=UPI0033ED3CED
MPEYLSPGVYIEELPGPQPIQGVSTSTTGMVGVTKKGPSRGRPRFVTSFAEFRQQFGGFLTPPADLGERARWELDDNEGGEWWLFPLAVKGFFDNGGRRLFVKRVVSADAAESGVDLPSGAVTVTRPDTGPPELALTAADGLTSLLRASATAPGEWGDDLDVRIVPDVARRIPAVAARGGPIATALTANVAPGETAAPARWREQMADLGPVRVTVAGRQFELDALPDRDGDVLPLTLPGAATERLRAGTTVKIVRRVDEVVPGDDGGVRVPLARVGLPAVYPEALVLVGPRAVQATVRSVEPPNPDTGLPGSVLLAGEDIGPVFETDQILVVEARVDVRYEPSDEPGGAPGRPAEVIEETFPALRLHPLQGQEGSIVDVIREESRLITLEVLPPPGQIPVVTWGNFPGSTQAGDRFVELGGGGNAFESLRPEDFVGADGGSGARTGIQALEDIDEISICAVPGMWSRTVQSALVGHCLLLRDRFAIVDPQRGLSVQDVQAFRQRLDTEFAALYHPWLKLRDPLSGKEVAVPPSGHLAGIYARTDVDRGVHKAPANVTIEQITGLADDITQREQDLLNPIGINALREFPQRGLRVWGARTLSSTPEWRYINVRRLFIYIEESIKLSTQWVVFEPNGEPLWALVRQALVNFLDTVWRTGALEGITQAEAFYVRCDRSTMSEDDVQNGRLIVEIGLAVTKPAEFVIFRFRQKTRDQVAAA